MDVLVHQLTHNHIKIEEGEKQTGFSVALENSLNKIVDYLQGLVVSSNSAPRRVKGSGC